MVAAYAHFLPQPKLNPMQPSLSDNHGRGEFTLRPRAAAVAVQAFEHTAPARRPLPKPDPFAAGILIATILTLFRGRWGQGSTASGS